MFLDLLDVFTEDVFFCPDDPGERSSAERRIHTPKGGAQPSRMNSHALAQVDPASWARAATDSHESRQPPPQGAPGCQTRDTASGTTSHLAANLRLWSTHHPRISVPAAFASEGPLRVTSQGKPPQQSGHKTGLLGCTLEASQGGVRRARTYPWLANHGARVSPRAPSG